MSLGVWGDESPAAERGSETELYAKLTQIAKDFDEWLANATREGEFWSPQDEELADQISSQLDTLRSQMGVKL
jgi:hypothetical protein